MRRLRILVLLVGLLAAMSAATVVASAAPPFGSVSTMQTPSDPGVGQ